MTALRGLALVGALGATLFTPQAAAGGGWWSYVDVNRSTVAPGQRVVVTEKDLFFRSRAEAKEAAASDRFYVYLLRDLDHSIIKRAMSESSPGDWWSLGGAEAIRVGRVAVSVRDANLARATAAFTVPDVPPATYHLMLCDAACAEPLADVIPTKGLTVVADPATAQMAQRVDDLDRQYRQQARELRAARGDADSARVAARSARSEAQQLEARLSSLTDEVRSSSRVTWWPYAGWLLAGALLGALVVLGHRGRRVRRRRPTPDAAWHSSDEELRELLASGPTNRR